MPFYFFSDGGNKKCNRTLNLIVFHIPPYLEIESNEIIDLSSSINNKIASLPIQVMAEQRWGKTSKRSYSGESESPKVQSLLKCLEELEPEMSEKKKNKIVKEFLKD